MIAAARWFKTVHCPSAGRGKRVVVWFCAYLLLSTTSLWAATLTIIPHADLKNTDPATQQEITVALQRVAYDRVPYVNYGQWFLPTAYRSNLRGVIVSPVPFFWNIQKEG